MIKSDHGGDLTGELVLIRCAGNICSERTAQNTFISSNDTPKFLLSKPVAVDTRGVGGKNIELCLATPEVESSLTVVLASTIFQRGSFNYLLQSTVVGQTM